MGISYFTFNGTSSTSFDIRIEKCPDYPVAQRAVERIHVDGRNGDLVRDTGAYENVEMTYEIYFNAKSTSFQEVARDVAFWLNGSAGYCRLEDSYDPDVYRMALMSNYTVYRNWLNDFGRATVTFSCKPQRFLKTGETEITPSGTIPNAYMPCYPLLKVTGNGSIDLGGNVITVTNNTGITMYIDTETQNAYSSTTTDGKSQYFGFITLSAGASETKEVTLFQVDDYDPVYLSFSFQYGNYIEDFVYEIDTTQAFSQTITRQVVVYGVTYTYDVTITRAVGSNQIVFSSTSGVSILNAMVRTAWNRNKDISLSGSFPSVPTGGLPVSSSGVTLKVIPRWWTL